MDEAVSPSTREKLKQLRARKKLNRTLYHMVTNIVGEVRFKAPPSPPGRTFLGRLSYLGFPKLRRDEFDLERTLANVGDFWIFLDSSFFDHETDPDVLRKLRVRNRLFILPGVADQMKAWLRASPDAVVARELFSSDGHPDPGLFDVWHREKFLREYSYVFRYYVQLLAVRRELLRWILEDFEGEKGAHATEAERRKVFRRVHDTYGPRAYSIAKKSCVGGDKRLDVTDEAVVVAAVLCGIVYGKECMILGKDEDLVEQFYKLTSLLKIHLGARMFQQYFQENTSEFERFPLCSSTKPFCDFMVGEGNFLVERPPDLDFLLPRRIRPTCLYCWLVGDYYSGLTFCAEDALLELLDCKEASHGLNTDGSAHTNCHIHRFPIPVPNPRKAYAAFVHDKRVPGPLVSLPVVDIHHALVCDETTIAHDEGQGQTGCLG
ncbi:hypothetical protein HQ563_07480 [bacterium]|nr:hypothetical protein [bacterium]